MSLISGWVGARGDSEDAVADALVSGEEND
jgi:hypothetical protein